ncbi:MAG: FadR/GntR family transcriptional regulator [Thermoleophilaceae bacterium]
MPRLHRQLVTELIAQITSGELVEGASLPREADLAERFDVSRGVARESFRALEERGLIRVKHGRGATVRPADEWDLFDGEVMAGMLSGPRAAPAVAASLECLRIVEVEAAGLAAERASSEDLLELSRALERMEAPSTRAGIGPISSQRPRKAELAFHRALMHATRNPSLARIAEPLHEALAAARQARRKDGPMLRIGHYQRVLEAVAQGDPDAARSGMQDCLDALARDLGAAAGAPG